MGMSTHFGKGKHGIAELDFYKFVIRSLPVAVLAVNHDLKITDFNPQAERITGYSKEEVLDRYCGEVLRGGLCKGDCPLRSVMSQRDPVVRVDTTIHRKSGDVVSVRLNVGGLVDTRGNLVGGIEAFEDISYLKALEREKENIISMFAHDMKSPLISIHGFSQRLLNAVEQDEEKRKKYLEIIAREAEKLEHLVNDFLDYSLIKSSKLKMKFERIAVKKALWEVYEAYLLKAERRNLRLQAYIEETLPEIEADLNRLIRAVSNLLDNAIKYSRKGGTVRMEAVGEGSEVIIRVEDDGMGISPEDLPFIFDPYHRGKNGSGSEGYGVGLASVKAIVEAHGGRVMAQSALGKGSVFTVVLPMCSGHGGKREPPQGNSPS
jgi:two-component system phosphate regulon sensor histidine kinase PhoR